MVARDVAQCRCCRLPIERPRRLWVLVVAATRQPRLVAVCRGCWMALRECAVSMSVVGVNRVIVAQEVDYAREQKSKRALRGAAGGAGEP